MNNNSTRRPTCIFVKPIDIKLQPAKESSNYNYMYVDGMIETLAILYLRKVSFKKCCMQQLWIMPTRPTEQFIYVVSYLQLEHTKLSRA